MRLGVLSAKKILLDDKKEGRWLSGIEDTWWTSWAVDFDGYEGEDSLIDDGAAIINQSFGQNTFKYHKEGVQYCLLLTGYSGSHPVIHRTTTYTFENRETGEKGSNMFSEDGVPRIPVEESVPGISAEDLAKAADFRIVLEDYEKAANKRYPSLFRDSTTCSSFQSGGNDGADARGKGGVCSMTAQGTDNTLCVASFDPLQMTGMSRGGPEFLLADYSNTGGSVGIAAPGDRGLFSTGNSADKELKEYKLKSGTSMAAPVVTGVAGLVWNAFPELSASQVREAILAGAVGEGCRNGKSEADCVPLLNAYGSLKYAAEALAGEPWIPLPEPSPTATLTATPTSIASGQGATLIWSSTNVVGGCWSDDFPIDGNSEQGSVEVFPESTTTYSIVCFGWGRSDRLSHGHRHDRATSEHPNRRRRLRRPQPPSVRA